MNQPGAQCSPLLSPSAVSRVSVGGGARAARLPAHLHQPAEPDADRQPPTPQQQHPRAHPQRHGLPSQPLRHRVRPQDVPHIKTTPLKKKKATKLHCEHFLPAGLSFFFFFFFLPGLHDLPNIKKKTPEQNQRSMNSTHFLTFVCFRVISHLDLFGLYFSIVIGCASFCPNPVCFKHSPPTATT